MEVEFTGRLHLRRTPDEKRPLLQRLGRIEGQVRGLRQMVEDDRHCLDVVQQASAITAAVREVALLVISDHLTASVDFAVQARDGEAAVGETAAVLRAALRR
jgi:CsoR family transcriptional regulator, copper-sensing transcriptional repressor